MTKPSTATQETQELESQTGKLKSAVANALRESAEREDEARQVAGHTEEPGEVCTSDCLACGDPVRAVIRDLREARNEAFQRGRSIAALTDEVCDEPLRVPIRIRRIRRY